MLKNLIKQSLDNKLKKYIKRKLTKTLGKREKPWIITQIRKTIDLRKKI